MGSGSFNPLDSAIRSQTRKATNTDFFQSSKTAKECHHSMHPKNKPVRECRDNDDNPESVPVAIILDVTGSNTKAANPIADNIHKAMSVILDAGVKHPAILFGAVGDNKSDVAAFQVGEFESSDLLFEESSKNIWLEGGGGGQGKESYSIPLAFFAFNVQTDHYEKRGKKGHLFIIADEASHDLSQKDIQDFSIKCQEPMSIEEAYRQASLKWHVWILRPSESGYATDKNVITFWQNIAKPETVINLSTWEELNGTVASLVALNEESDVDAIKKALDDHKVPYSSDVSLVRSDKATSTIEVKQEQVSRL